ncbi:Ig-like domain-containing protein [Paludisphaera rhizosphaerae]|uniref:Ig-like domain-containing protein n=1 Tax=Paludisphaera rhizosphaerae TaxID=2711216 RepID=UPI0013EB5CCF|nr:Ig-like domain-containing protein [Paludisphaera rhizosphaerae]
MLEDRRLLANPGLSINIVADSVAANAGPGATTGTVTRTSADNSQALTVSLTSSAPNAASVPATVVIQAGKTSASFTVDTTLDDLTPVDRVVRITASATIDAFLSKDTSFHTVVDVGGWVVTTQADGKIVTARAYAMENSDYGYSVRRYNSDGTLDSTFHEGGIANVGLSARNSVLEAVAVQPDGKIVVAGFFTARYGARWSMQLVRLTADGQLDDSFGTQGWVTLAPTSGSYNEIYDITVLPDGKILFGGCISNVGSDEDFAVGRLNEDGSLDTTFGNGGYATTSFSVGSDLGRALVVQPDGKILLAGSKGGGTGDMTFALARWTADGRLDSTFGSAGRVETKVPGIYGRVNDILIQPDGKILVAGYSSNAGIPGYGSSLVRYTTSGTLDASFGVNGSVRLDFGAAVSMVGLEDGTIVIGGESISWFDANGAVLGTISDKPVNSMALQNGERIIAVGYAPATGYYIDAYIDSLPLGAHDEVTVMGTRTPTAVDDVYNIQKSATLAITTPGVLGNDDNPAGGLLTAVLVAGPKHGSVSLNADGSFVYTPSGTYLGPDSFTYKATNGTSTSNVATVALSVVGANDAPTAGVDSYELVVSGQTTQLQVQSPGVLANDGDVNGQPITAVLDSAPKSGKLVLNSNGSFSYTPNIGFYGVDHFTYRASDGDLSSAPTTVTISVYAQPTATAEVYTAEAGAYLIVAAPGVLANDVSPAGLPLRAVLAVGPKSGGLSLKSDGSFSYRPNAGFLGRDSFTYYATDGKLSTATTTVTINVVFVNKPPVAGDDAYSFRPGSTLVVAAPGLIANDKDPDGQAITASLVTPPAHGSLTLNANGSFTYTPTTGWSGPDSFTYRANDGDLGSALATVNLIVADTTGALWTQRGGNAGHSSYVDARVNAAGITLAWNQSLTYVASGNWAQSGNQAVAIDDMYVYRTSLDGSEFGGDYHIIAYDLKTGAAVWNQVIVGNGPVSAPSVVNGRVYVNRSGHSRNIDGTKDEDRPWIYVLDARTGAVLQRETYEAQWDSDERPVIDGNQLFAPKGYYGGFGAWMASIMSSLWSNNGPQLQSPSVAVAERYVYAYDDMVYSRSNGAYLGEITPPARMNRVGSPVVSGSGRVLFSVSGFEGKSVWDGVSSYDGQTRTPIWTTLLPSYRRGLAVGNGIVAVTSSDQLILLDEETGSQRGVWQAPSGLSDQIVLTHTHAFVQAGGNNFTRVYAINLATNQVDWTYDNRTDGYLMDTNMEMAFVDGRLVLTNDAFVMAFNVPDAPPTTATYEGSDATTRGNWDAAYGAGGYAMAASANTLDAAFDAGSTPAYTWQAGGSDPRGLEQPQAPGRILAAWYKDAFTVAVDAGATPQKVSLYFVDADGGGRSQRVEVLDAATGAVLDTRDVSDFGGGVYLTWILSGEAKFRITRTGGPNAVLSGVFVGGGFDDGGHQESATASYEGSDATTQGAWDSAYGAGGYALAGSADTLGAAFSSGDTAAYTWQAGGSDPRGLADPLASGRLLAAWYKDTFSVSLDAGATAKRVSLYFVDADGGGRSQRVEVLDAATGAVLDDRTVSDFSGGVYLTWTLSGKVSFRITRIGGPNAVLSGVFVDGAQVSVPTAAYKGSDATTRGDWASAYGAGGYAMAASGNTLGASAGFGVDAPAYTWQAGSADPRGLADPLASGRLLAAWYKDTFTVTLDAGSAPKQASLYFLDADGGGRSQRVEVLDATTGAVLDTRVVSDFSGGVYLTWTLSGKVSFRITRIGGPNAVLSGLFID